MFLGLSLAIVAQAHGQMEPFDEAKIYQAAKREGVVVFYTAFNLNEVQVIAEAFQRQYPGVTIEPVRAQPELLRQRFMAEADGGRVLADVLEVTCTNFNEIMRRGYLQPFTLPNAKGFDAARIDRKNHLWVATRVIADVIGYNKNLIKEAEVPRTYEQAGDPKYKGKFLMVSEDADVMASLIYGKYDGDERKVEEIFRKIAANDPIFFRGHPTVTQQLASGTRPIGLGVFAHNVDNMAKKGAPVDWIKQEGVLQLLTAGIPKGVPHPNSARLFLNWFVGEGGAKTLAKIERISSRPGALENVMPAAKSVKWYAYNPEQAEKGGILAKTWSKIFNLR